MSNRKSSSWFYPNSTGDPCHDRNARTLQFSCFLLALGVSAVLIVSAIGREWEEAPLMGFALAGFVAAALMNRAGRSDWAGRIVFLVVLLDAILLVFQAHDGFRSHSMMVFPGLLLISVMMMDRASYLTTAGIVVVTVAALGIAVKHGLTRATPPVRTTYDSIFYVDLYLLVVALIGGRIARDTQRNAFELGASVDRLSAANLELVQIREHLQDSEERLQSAQRLTHVGSWHWNLGASQVVCSEECKRIFGQPEDYAPSLEGLLQIITPPDRARVANEIQRGIAEKSGCSTEFRVAWPNGELRTVTFTSQVALDEEGSPRHVFGACQDVTDDRRAQEEALAGQKLETVGTLANGVAHDFNNLLGAVLAQAELAQAELASGSYPEEELEVIRKVAIRGSEIVRQLMIYAGNESEVLELVDLSRIVDEMLALLTVSVSKHARLETDLGKCLPPVRASPAQLRQILMNLVTNASEAMGERDGVIRVATRCVTLDPTAAISWRLTEGDYLRLEVSDAGCGIPRETQAKVFDPFFTTKSAGRGLGLAVVDGIVRGLGGAIRFTSELGKGTTFKVLLACAGTSAETMEDQGGHGEKSAGPSQKVTVLVVEDEDPLRQAVVKMLRRTGFSVIEAHDGSQALKTIREYQNPIDILFLDLNLPGTPSREILEETKRLRPEIRPIITSAYPEDFAAASLQVRVEFLRKPYRLRELVDLVCKPHSSRLEDRYGPKTGNM
jgi:PAS domain S-box-containing protein